MLLLILLLVAAIAGAELSVGTPTSPAANAPSQAQLTMAQAVTIAEAKLNGRVVKAKLAREDAANVFNLKLATAGISRTERRRLLLIALRSRH